MTASLTYPEPLARRRSRRVRLTTLRLVRESTFPAPDDYIVERVPLHCRRDVFRLMDPYAAREVGESLWILPLDAQHQLIGRGPTVITRGILNSSLVHPREVFCAAILASAYAVILVHNHPSGDATPSADDRAVTAQVAAAGKLLDIPVQDHVIIGRSRYVSLAELGLL